MISTNTVTSRPAIARALFCSVIFLLLAMPAGAATAVADHGVIILYHHISKNTPFITSISPEDFEQQMQYLEDHAFRVWPLPKLVDALRNRREIPDKVVAITFDDNFRSVYQQAFPRLKERGWPFTIFVSTDAVDHDFNMQSSWAQLREMAKYGATIANHSADHAHLLQYLPGETQQAWETRVTRDIQQAQRRIREETGQQHHLFAYPYGEFNRPLAQLVQRLGYVGIGQQSGPVGYDYPGLALPRFPFAGNYTALDDFALKVSTIPLPVASVSSEDSPLAYDDDRPSLTVTLAAGDYPARSLHCYGSGQGALKLQWLLHREVKISPRQPLPVGRSRYNCTLPTGLKTDGKMRYYWYSHPWIRFDKNKQLID